MLPETSPAERIRNRCLAFLETMLSQQLRSARFTSESRAVRSEPSAIILSLLASIGHAIACADEPSAPYRLPRRGRRLDPVRMGGAAVLHAGHHLRVRAVFRRKHRRRSAPRPGAVGI